MVVAEVTQPSLGVGYEIGRAVAMGKPILCLYRPSPDKSKFFREWLLFMAGDGSVQRGVGGGRKSECNEIEWGAKFQCKHSVKREQNFRAQTFKGSPAAQ